MNTNNLKRFAQEARKKLLEQVGAKLTFVLNADSAILREQAEQVQQLRLALDHTTKEQLIEKVAYTWFNRLMALRFMDANDYQPLDIRIITPKDGYTTPEILDEAKRGNIPEELKFNRQKIYDLLDGRIPSSNPQNEAFKMLLIASCNHLNTVFPFLFERINDYTELLLPDDLTSDFSIVTDIRVGMLVEDCSKVEIIGWLYQFYISEENARLIKSKIAYKKNEIAPASQLFTPKWIVQYLVDNTLGQLITELFPATSITRQLEFYIKPAYLEKLNPRNKKKLEEIKFFDPCVGSAHVLSHAFDVFYLIYKEQGYNESEIPALIISNNLFGTDIDERATQLSAFVLMMKGRQYDRRFLRKVVRPNVECLKDFSYDNKFINASVLGALIKVEPNEIHGIQIEQGNLFSDSQTDLNKLYTLLGQRYDVVVTNPPYISSSRMESSLKQYVETNYPDTKYDLFATFIIRCLELCNEDGLTGYMSPFVWMFIPSYEKLRKIIINNHFINNLIQLEYSGFDGATVPVCTFTIRNQNIFNAKGSYIRLTDFKGAKVQSPKTLAAINNPSCSWFYIANQNDFIKIPSSPIGYWISEKVIDIFVENTDLSKTCDLRQGLATADNQQFMRYWFEIGFENFGSEQFERHAAKTSNKKWFPHAKGGNYRKWFGNNDYVVNWENDGFEIKKKKENDLELGRITANNSKCWNQDYYFKEGASWSLISSSKFGVRYMPQGYVFDVTAHSLFAKKNLKYYIAYLNSKLTFEFLKLLSPTLSFSSGVVAKLPEVICKNTDAIVLLADESIDISRLDWDAKENSWEYKQNQLIKIKGKDIQDIEESYTLYQQYWKNKFTKLHHNEEALNKQFIEIYGLQEEVTSDVILEEITILQDEIDRNALGKLNKELIRESITQKVKNYHEISLPFISSEIMAQFMSYAVGCMFGRYSLDKEGLLLANQGETIKEYLYKISKTKSECTFLPDEDNIIPILDDEWFEDDIVGRFYQFLKVTFGEKYFSKNLAFIEEQLGKDIRKYFTKDYYNDHIQRYKKHPIYWMFSSPKGSFNVLIYIHRYTPDTISNILNKYLREFVGKLKSRKENLQHIMVNGSTAQITSAIKENDNIDKMLLELQEYERDILFTLATERIAIDLDDGVLVNYNKFGKAVKEITGLNDPATKKKVKEFDWIDTTQIR